MKTRIAVVGACVAALLLMNALLVVGLTWPVTEYSVAKAGALGDSFGWLNSVFSGFAFLGVVWTLLHQQQELVDARASQKIDRFEGTFFALIGMLRRNLDDIRVQRPDGGEAVEGVDALSHYTKQVAERLKKHQHWLQVPHGRLIYQRMTQKYARAMPLQARYLGTLEAILELVERDLGADPRRSDYLAILASQLTSAECRYLLFLTLRGIKPDRLSEMIVASPPLLKRMGVVNASESQCALFEMIHKVSLKQNRPEISEVLEGVYRHTRKLAEAELVAFERGLRSKSTSK